MKKKNGFTLAEVLITLGIIGVVAALTAPALVQNASNAKVGPTLSKVVSTIENANQQIMLDEGVSSLKTLTNSETGMKNKMLKYYSYLSEKIAGSSYESKVITSGDISPDVTYYSGGTSANGGTSSVIGWLGFHYSSSIDLLLDVVRGSQSSFTKGSFKGTFATLDVDINGIKTGPNQYGKDVFMFVIDNNGKVIPIGSKTYDWAYYGDNGTSLWSNSNGDHACNAEKVQTKGLGCAGSIFDNNLKVIYQ